MNPMLLPTAECGACAALEGDLFMDHEVIHDSNCPHQTYETSAIAIGPGRMFRNPRYDYLADMPPASSATDSGVLTEWLNEKSSDNWTFICVNNVGQYIFYRDEVGKPIEKLRLQISADTQE